MSDVDKLRLKIDVLRRRRDEIAKASPCTGYMARGGGRSGWASAVSRNANSREWEERLEKAEAELAAAEAEATR